MMREKGRRDVPSCAWVVPVVACDQVVCPFCKKASTIEHHGGYWCSNCGRFAKAPDPKLLPSNQKGYREPERSRYEETLSTPNAAGVTSELI